ncbi:MAG: hypothetical protein IJO33_04360 [Bacilli bacterium]|nr:hypothetical protein [Bacilli bacterium]
METLKNQLKNNSKRKAFNYYKSLDDYVLNGYYKNVNKDVEKEYVELFNLLCKLIEISNIIKTKEIEIDEIKDEISDSIKIRENHHQLKVEFFALIKLINYKKSLDESKDLTKLRQQYKEIHESIKKNREALAELKDESDLDTSIQLLNNYQEQFINIINSLRNLALSSDPLIVNYSGFIRTDISQSLIRYKWIQKDLIGIMIEKNAKLKEAMYCYVRNLIPKIIERFDKNEKCLTDEEKNKIFMISSIENQLDVNLLHVNKADFGLDEECTRIYQNWIREYIAVCQITIDYLNKGFISIENHKRVLKQMS